MTYPQIAVRIAGLNDDMCIGQDEFAEEAIRLYEKLVKGDLVELIELITRDIMYEGNMEDCRELVLELCQILREAGL